MARVAERQHGVVSRDQLRALGLTEKAIEIAAGNGRLHRIFHGSYAIGHAGVGWHGRALAAVLACGDGSVVSHAAAAFLLGIWESPPHHIDVTAPVEAGRKITGIRRRFVPPPPPGQIWIRNRIPCTSAARTIVDVAGIVQPRALSRTIEQAAVLGMLNVSEIDAILDEHRRRGERRLRIALEPWRRYSPKVRIRSRMEAKLLPLLTLHGLPIPECNVKLRIGREAFEVDFLWAEQRLIVETDGGKYHGNPAAQERDGHRNRVLARAGYRVPRIGWSDLRDQPEKTLAEITRFLRHRA